jgi:multicomponent Na+:H+ antiporter subunit F
MIALIAAAALALLIVLLLVRLYAGPTIYDRALAVNALLTKAALLCAAIAVGLGRSEGVEAAIVLVLCCFVLNVAVLKFFRSRTFQAALAREERSS